MRQRRLFLFALSFLPLSAVAVACSDDDPVTASDAGTDSSTFDSNTARPDVITQVDTGTTDPDSGDPGDGGTDAAADARITPTQLASFQTLLGQLPEGVATLTTGGGTTTVVGFAPQGRVVQVFTDGGFGDYGTFPGATDTFTLGMAVDQAQNLYVAVASTGPAPIPAAGVYRIPAGGGTPVLFTINTGKPMSFVNGLAFKGTDLYITDSTGTIFKADATGATTEWLTSDTLAGAVNDCNLGNGFPIGANGIVADADNLYVTNTDKGAIHKIPITADGGAGTITQLVKDPALCGADGLVLDKDGSFVIAGNAKNNIVRVTPAGVITVLSEGPPLLNPASVTFEGTGAARRLLITNAAFSKQGTDGGNPGLFSIPLP